MIQFFFKFVYTFFKICDKILKKFFSEMTHFLAFCRNDVGTHKQKFDRKDVYYDRKKYDNWRIIRKIPR